MTDKKLTDFDALTFDCYGTLIDWESGMVAGLKPLTDKVARKLTRDEILEAHAFHESTQQAQTPAQPTTGDAAVGAQLFQERTCINCHAIAGTAGQARVGPDLTHLATRATLAAGLLTNTPENLRAWLKAPHTLKPGTLMPDLHLTDAEVEQLATYLETLP